MKQLIDIKLKKFLFVITTLPFLCVLLFTRCNKNNIDDNGESAQRLFGLSVELINEYKEKINSANDNETLDSLVELFEKKITDINFSVPPETDLKLTEEENDSIYNLLSEIMLVIKKKNIEFMEKDDQDSLSIKENRREI